MEITQPSSNPPPPRPTFCAMPASPPDPRDTVHLGLAAASALSQREAALAARNPSALAHAQQERILSLYDQILADADHAAKHEQWSALIEMTEAYLAMPGSLDGPDFGPLTRTHTNDPNVNLVCVHAPRPYLAGTMSRNWNYVQEETADGMRVQKIGADTCLHPREARVWRNGEEECMTLLGTSVASTQDIYISASVYTLQSRAWQPSPHRVMCDATEVEGCPVLSGNAHGEFWLEPRGSGLSTQFDGDSNDVVITGGEEPHAFELVDGQYRLHVPTPEEKQQKARDRLLARLDEALEHPRAPNAVICDGSTVSVGGVTIPVRQTS